MGKRTQIIVNLKVVDKQNNNIIEREVLHYQWGGHSNVMFLSLRNFFTNVKLFIGGIETGDIAFSSEKNYTYGILKNNLINVLKNPYCFFMDLKDYNLINSDLETFFKKSFKITDCDQGRILIDLLFNIKKGKKYCKWCFITEKDEILELKDIPKEWNFDKVDNFIFNRTIDSINETEVLLNAGNGNLENFKIEYDPFHFQVVLNK